MTLPAPPSWRQALNARLQPPYLRLVALAVITVALALAVLAFATAGRGRTAFGPPLGADFAGFFVAAQILDRGQPDRLYDPDLHARLYHELLPDTDPHTILPYVHPPFVAGALRPLTWLPYESAVAVWMVISAALYAGGTLLVLRACPELGRRHRGLVLLLALSFEPFLFECWLGGQLSAVGFFGFALAYYLIEERRPFAAGLALGICFYKPTLLVLVLPGLLFARQWRVLAGMTVTGLVLGFLSLLTVGWETCRGYLDVLLAFRQSTSSGTGLEIRTWKYVDLNNNGRLLFGNTPWNLWIVTALAAVPLVWLLRSWWRRPVLSDDRRRLLWAATLVLTPVLNLYVGVYDSILVVQAAIILADVCLLRGRSLTDSGWAYVILAVAATPWFSQNLAQLVHVQLFSWALLFMAWFVSCDLTREG